ncbi:FlaD/FlaE family flagellar protein [Thermococcus sp.]
MEEVRLVTEADINAKLSELKGKVPTVIINDLREKLISKKDTLTYDQLEKIIQRVLDAYGSQATKYEQISKRVDELGKRLGELSMQLSRLIESLEEKKFEIHEKKAEKVEEKIGKVKEKLERIEEKVEEVKEEKEEIPAEIVEELPEKIEELHEKVEEIAEKIVEEKPEEKPEIVEVVEEEKIKEIPPEIEEKPEEVEEKEKIEEIAPEEAEKVEVVEEVEEEKGVEVEKPVEEIVEKPSVEEVKEEKVEVPAHEEVEEIKEEGGEMAEEKLSLPQDIANLLFAEEPKKARLEKIPEDIVSTMIALKWLGFLIDRVGIQNLERILEFYYEIGWISENVLNTLLRYAKGTRPHHRDPEWKPAEKLTVQDHLISLLFIERLRGLRITRDVLDKLERELKMLEKTLDEFYGV